MNNCAPIVEPDAIIEKIENELKTLDKTTAKLKNSVDYYTTSLCNLSKTLGEALSDLAGKTADWLSTINKAGEQLAEVAKKAEASKSTKQADAHPLKTSIEEAPEST